MENESSVSLKTRLFSYYILYVEYNTKMLKNLKH